MCINYAHVNIPATIHSIACVWDRVNPPGDPKNVPYGTATYRMGVSEAVSPDIVSPQDRPTNNAIVDRTMGAAMRGAVTVLMNKPDADPQTREGDDIPLR